MLAVLTNISFGEKHYFPKSSSHLKEQDKVNYAVSEREGRVTDVTMLTRMTGCTGIYWTATGL